ncbi:interferon-induced very large GTPase 1-like [Chanodichthys erythropterus]|uniref:interferon-induced very large GTPase 1-like n=1 Tax=Chanodichthys erythropterus TaxID=933992 RepID=UPI00351F057B
MALPAVHLLCLEQGDRSLEQHTSDFLQLACLTHFRDRSLCIYYRTGLSERSKARIPAGGPTEDFAAYVEWVLVNNNSPFTIGPAEDDTSTTPHPETNHPPSTTCTMEKREPTADRGDQPAGTYETEPEERTEGVVAPGCEPLGVSDQVRESATSCAVEGVLVEFEGWEESPDHNITTVDAIVMSTETFLDLLDVFEEVNFPCLVSPLVPSSSELSVSPLVPSSSELCVSPLVPSSSELCVSPLVPSSSELSVPLLVLSSPVFPPNLPLPPPQTTYSSSLPPLVPFSLSSTPSRKCMDPTRCFRPPVSPWTEVLLAPPPAFESNTPPRPVDASPSPWLLPPSAPPDTLSLKTPPGSLVPQAPTWSDVVQPAPTVSPGSSFPPVSSFVLGRTTSVFRFPDSNSTWITIIGGFSIGRPQGGASSSHDGFSCPRLHPGASSCKVLLIVIFVFIVLATTATRNKLAWIATEWNVYAMRTVRPDGGKRDETCQNPKLGPKCKEELNKLYYRLDLTQSLQDEMRTADILEITKSSFQEPQEENELVNSFLQKLINMDYRARYTAIKQRKKDHQETPTTKKESEKEDANYNPEENHPDIHPMDVQMAVFHCADGFLKQLMVTKLSQCQYSLPLLVPDPFTQQIEFPLWTFRQINKSWKKKNSNNEIISQTQPVYKAETPMVAFFRFGSVSSSKSQLINSLINEKHQTFFHRNCPGSSRTRLLMDGVVEIAWYCPSGKKTDSFDDCVAFCNLHGDAGASEKQYEILTSMASVNVLFLPDFGQKNQYKGLVRSLFKSPQPLICLLTDSDCDETELGDGKFITSILNKNQSDVSNQIREMIRVSLTEQKKTFKLEDVAEHTGIRVDEEDPECRRGKEAAIQIMGLLRGKDPSTVKEINLPCQGKLWHDWCKINKELRHLEGENLEEDKSTKLKNMREIRETQMEQGLNDFMMTFIETVKSQRGNENNYFLKWTMNLLDDFTSEKLFDLHMEYDKKWHEVSAMKKKPDNLDQLQTEQTNLENISEQINKTGFGLEHILREFGQIYESWSTVKKKKDNLQFDFCSLLSLAADMMISGFPMELMDGDAAHVPLTWVTAVLDELVKKLGDQTRIFVLSILGIQSSGKSTMLNAMFGLQFAVSAGRCTRGAFMQLLKVSEKMKTELKFDYILVVDTEGLRAPELAGRSTTSRDNEMATFVVGLGNMTLINIFGENPSEMQDILQIVVQAFMRMKNVRLNPSCMFVHQNVSDITAGEKNTEGRRRLQEKLDEMTRIAAKEEDCDAEGFSDVIEFDVQNDVKYFAQLWEGSPPMAPPNPNYCENIQELKETILTHASKSDGIMLIHLRDRVKDLWEALLNEQFVFSFKNSLEIATYKKLETEYSKWTWSLRSAMLEIENKLHNKIENKAFDDIEENDLQRELNPKREEVEKTMSELFSKDRDAAVLNQWKASFEIKINQLQENIVRETKRKLNKVLQQRHLKKKMDTERTLLENTLLEKSKKLALKFNYQANDEHVVKKEFESFWKQQMMEINRDAHSVTNIDIFTDVKQYLKVIYASLPLNHIKESSEHKDMISLASYSKYVKIKKSSGFTGRIENAYKGAKEFIGYSLSKEDEVQIRSLITDIAKQTDKMIQSYNIAKMGYNHSCIQQLIDHIKARLMQHEEVPKVKYVFKSEFFLYLVLFICHRANKTFTEQYKMFRETNDPVLYFERKSQEYYRIFQKYCQGASSTAVFGEVVCNKLKKPIQQNIYKKNAKDLADEMMTNCESLNGNRSKLEKHILKTLAEKQDFKAYLTYINNPRAHFKNFIRDEVSQYITEQFIDCVRPKMENNIKLLEQKITNAAHESTEHVKKINGDADSWLLNFTQQLSDVLVFSLNDLTGVNHDDVEFRFLEDVIKKELPSIISDIRSEFSTETFPVKLEPTDRPDELLINHLCDCCWVQCPFCAAICTNTIECHTGDHSVPFHRNLGLNGWFYRGTTNLSTSICTSAVASDRSFYSSDDKVPWKEYRKGGPKFASWSITPDLSELPYWKWFVCRFQEDLEKHYEKTFQGSGEIPDEWRKYSQKEAIESLDKYI